MAKDADYIYRILAKRKRAIIPKEHRYRLLDLFCGAGGACKGYQMAGFYVVGIDIKLQKNYCGDDFIVANAVRWMRDNVDYVKENFDAIHASPPCQLFSSARKDNNHPNLIEPIRPLIHETGLPYVMENVRFAPLQKPIIELCGSMFGLSTYRDRWFEINFPVVQPPHNNHVYKTVRTGREPAEGELIQVLGRFSGAERGAWAMGINWMTRDELCEAVPPAYTGYIGSYLMKHVISLNGNRAEQTA